MEGWLIYSKTDAETNKYFIRWFQEAATNEQITLRLILREDLTAGVTANKPTIQLDGRAVTLPDFAVVRTVEPLLNLHLEKLGIKVYNNAETAYICNHKGLTHHHVNKLAVPMANTLYWSSKNDLSGPAPMPFPFVTKTASGRSGKDVHLVTNINEWEQLKHTPFTDDLVIQSARDIQFGKDVRVFVVGTDIIGAVLRDNKHDFRANYKLGGSATWYALAKHEITLVKQITEYFRFGMVGIDFLLDQNGRFVFNEIEDVVGSRTLSAVSDTNILRHYVQHIKSGNSS
ncbi:ATP-grasp domain-containing protein [Lentibacillus salinarum]|uniref:RimK family alpha-L-glutamate ligase n=1 Tax=Lentibacillus salinarum TaxID=446820 RepID=A0ABW3ZWX6_9BACI